MSSVVQSVEERSALWVHELFRRIGEYPDTVDSYTEEYLRREMRSEGVDPKEALKEAEIMARAMDWYGTREIRDRIRRIVRASEQQPPQ